MCAIATSLPRKAPALAVATVGIAVSAMPAGMQPVFAFVAGYQRETALNLHGRISFGLSLEGVTEI